MKEILVAKDIKKSFFRDGTEVSVLRGIDLTLMAGEMTAIMGPSGAGKSTLLHILGALDRPSSGRLSIDGADVFKHNDDDLARLRNLKVGFVFQFHHLLPEFTALENAAMPARIAGFGAEEANEMSKKLLTDVGLGHRLDHRPTQLSGGEQQRVALARALVLKPAILLADEPTGNLDGLTGGYVHELLKEMNSRYNVALLVATHNPELARDMGKVITIEDGVLV